MSLFEQLNRYYTDSSFPGALGGLRNFFTHLKKLPAFERLTWKQLQEWKRQQALYTKYKPVRKRFLRRPYRLFGPNRIWEADLLDMSDFASRNRRVHFLLTVVDQFTKKLFVAPCKQKNQTDVLNAFRDIFERQTMSRPRIIYSDNGKEFLNSAVSHYLESIRIRHVTTNDSSIKGAIVERANQTLKRKLVKSPACTTASTWNTCKTSSSDSTTACTPRHDSHPTPSIPSPSTRLESTSKKASFDDKKNTPSGTNAPTVRCCTSAIGSAYARKTNLSSRFPTGFH
eukprot:gene8699-biopygen6998